MPIIGTTTDFTDWDELTSQALPHLVNCPRFLIEQYIKKAAREFFAASCLWRSAMIDLLTTVSEQATYTFNLPANAELNRVHTAWKSGQEIEVDVILPGEVGDDAPDESSDDYRIGVEDGGSSLYLSPIPLTADVALIGTVSYLPAVNATGIPTWIYNTWRDDIIAGAVAKLVVQPAKPWSNPGAYALHSKKFDEGIMASGSEAGPVRRRGLRVSPL